MPLYHGIADFYDRLFPLRESRSAFVDSHLADGPLSVLDIGCATGELASVLAQKGHDVTGLDLDGQMITQAREKFPKTDNLRFLQRDMTLIAEQLPPNTFDAVLCFGNTLVHLPNPAVMKGFFQSVNTVLKKGGVFLIQVVNYDRLLAEGVPELPLLKRDGLTFTRTYDHDSTDHHVQFNGRLEVAETGQVFESSERLYPLTSKEMKELLETAGFSATSLLGNEKKAPYDRQSPALIAVAKKR
ncbi:MAG: class I SAM-dependent methyltransferase [bacterium]|nr:class I SAM-dependent methyltransferase [bacterium]